MKFTERITSTAKLVQSLGLAMLLFCFAPLHAQSQGFKSTSAYQSSTSVQNPNAVNQYNAYRSTIYQPFSESAPSNNGPSSGPSKINDRRNAVIGIPGWGDTMSEPLPIGDTLPLFLFAAAMITIIAIKQRKQKQLTTQTQSTNNNNPTQHMTTRKQTYQSLRQKLFLLLVFVCIAGQVSADKTIYFRPGTRNFSIGYQTKTQANKRTETANEAVQNSIGTYADVHWIKNSRIAYKVTGHSSKADIESKAHQTIVRDSVQSGKQSRFLPITIPTGYTGVKIYRTSSSTYTTFNSWSWVHGASSINKSNTIPVWSASDHEPSSSLSVDRADGKNLICNREGWYDEYYWAYYLPKNSGVKIYFADINGWDNAEKTNSIQMLTGKDIYTFPTAKLVNIKNTKLYYLELTKEYGYEYYGFILNSTAWSEAGNIPAISSTFLDAANTIKGFVDDSSITQSAWNNGTSSNVNLNTYNNRIANRIKKATKRTGLREDLLSGANLFIPGAANDAAVDKQTLGSWQDLNHTQTVIVEDGGTLNYQTTKLTDEGTRSTYSAIDQTNTVTFTAAYTATTILRAKPIDGYYFLGFFDEATGDLLTRGEKMTDAEGGYVYRYDAPNAPRTIKARFTPIKQVCIQYPTNASWTAWNTESIGNILKINYTDLTGNPVEFTFDKYPTENISEDVYITNDSYRRIYIKNIDIDRPLTFTATEDNDHTFIGWRYDAVRFTDNPWTVSDKSGNAFTARFVKFLQHTINVQTYNKEQNKYVLSEDGGSVEITYKKLDHTQVGDFDRQYKTNVSLRDTYSIPSNTSVTLTATLKDGYSFVGWYEGQNLVSKELIYTYTAETARNITAYFAKGTETTTLDVRAMRYNGTGLEESLAGGTFTMTHSGGIVYEHNTVGYVRDIPVSVEPVTFFATPNDGYEFIGWFNNDNGQHPDNPWIMQDPSDTGTYDESVSAVFASPNYVVKQDIKIEGPGTVTANYLLYPEKDNQNRTFNHNFSFNAWKGEYNITLTAAPFAGYKFDGWYKGNTQVSTNATYSYTANAAQTITAKFKSAVNKLTVSVLNYNPEYDKFEEYGYEYNTITLKQESSVLKESYSSFSHEFNDATSVTLTATPEDGEDGYDFIGWYQNDTLLNKGATINVNVMGLQAISARFAPKQSHPIILVPNSAGTYTIRFGKDETKPENMYSKESSLTDTVITYAPYSYFYTVSSAKPILGYKFVKMYPNGNINDQYSLGQYSGQQEADQTIVVNFVRSEAQEVYLHLNDKWNHTNQNYYVYATNVANSETAWFKMTSVDNGRLYKYTIPGNTYSHIAFAQGSSEPTGKVTDYTGNKTKLFTIPATRYNCMTLESAYNSSSGKFEDMWSEPPTQVGDFRLVYIEQTVESKDSITVDYTFDDAGLIKKKANSLDTISLHIYNKVSDDIDGINNPEIILQRCTGFVGSKSQWEEEERRMVFGPLRATDEGVIRMPGRRNAGATINYDNGIDSIKNYDPESDPYKGSGVWNFVISQDNAGNATILADQTHRYTGDYYIRTTNADGQYNNYTHPGNVMKLSEYAAANSDYSHYFIRYVDINEDGTPTAEAGKHPVIKFAIANDYSVYLNHEFMLDNDRFKDDEYGVDKFVLNNGGAPNLPADASVRFGWDIVTNRLTRAYIANTTIKNNEYLIVEGTNIGTPSGDATYFTDNSNWLYTIDLNATANAAAKVKAKMNGQYQYFMGSESKNDTLISGNGASPYPIRLLYDFKDDRFTTIYRPNAALSGTVNLETPVMIEREHNNAPTQIQFNSQAKITVEDDNFDQPAYAVMTFLESVLANNEKTHHEKMFYWVSFPFDVKISDVFGLGDYGQYWIMQYYDGAQRAASGLAQTNWKYILDTEEILEANKGYVICLNYNQILQDQLFKSYGSNSNNLEEGKLSLYFPSNSVVRPADIKQQNPVVVNLDQHPIGQNVAWNHWNWHVIGVPSYANPTFSTIQGDVPFFYQYWHPTDGYAAVASTEVDFYAMHSYMVQYAGDITWNSVVNIPKNLAARTNAEDKPIMLRLELQQEGNMLDKTYVQLRSDKGTLGFDLNLDLSKVINAGANIYSVVSGDQMAGNAIPKEETVIPIGVVITTAGNYTFAMPNGTGGMIVELIDYEQGTSTNLLAMDYTVNLPKATNNTRFALRLKPNKVATSVENIGEAENGANGDAVRKLLIDGVLYLQKGNLLYDAQGRCIQ